MKRRERHVGLIDSTQSEKLENEWMALVSYLLSWC